MNPEQLLQHFDRISEAPDAIPRLRRFILDLAVRGKLVEQKPNDEPAAELLKRIQSKKTKQSKTHQPEFATEELSFPLPGGWSATRFGDVFSLEYGDSLPADKRSNTGEYPVYGSNGVVGSHHECFVRSPCIVVGRKGSAGALNLCLTDGCCVTDVAYYCIPPEEIDLAFSFKLFHTLGLDALGKGVKPGLSRSEAYFLPITIPPLLEQHRIVAKVDELMALCDQLQAAQTERELSRDRLVAASLHSLNPPADDGTANAPETQREHARFIFNHLPRLTTRPAHIKQLRQTILNLAVRGKLVPQDPHDEPAVELLNRIQMQRVASGIKPKTINVGESCSSHSKPRGWEWCEIEELSKLVTDGEHATPTRILEQEIPLVTAKNVRDGEMDYAITDWVSRETAEKAWKRCKPEVGDILLVCVGATTGRLCVLQEAKEMVLVRSVALIRPEIGIDVNYLALAIRSPLGQTQIWGSVKATAQPCLYINKINNLSFPLPPIAEQHRIVAKVDELMALCDQLETQLTSTAADSSRLQEALLNEALLPASEQAA